LHTRVVIYLVTRVVSRTRFAISKAYGVMSESELSHITSDAIGNFDNFASLC